VRSLRPRRGLDRDHFIEAVRAEQAAYVAAYQDEGPVCSRGEDVLKLGRVLALYLVCLP